MSDEYLNTESKRRKLPTVVLRALIDGGSTIEELASRKNLKNIPVGGPDQIQHQSKAIWHSKPEIDQYVRNKLSITGAEWEVSDSHRDSVWFNYVAQEISKLRKDGTITDWNTGARTGIWRLTHLKGISSVEPPVGSTNCWIWSVDPKNWTIVKNKNIWASKITQKIRDRVRPGDKVIFYVIGKKEFQGIFEFFEEWYDAKEPVWDDETDSILYPSQIKLKPLKIGSVKVYDVASKLQMFSNPDDKRLVNLVLKGGGGYPSNNGKPILYEDYKILYELMSNNNSDTSDKDPEAKLPMLSTSDIQEGYDLISKELLIPKEKIIEIITALLSGRHILLAGPIGTGKTALATLIPKIFWKRWGGYDSEIVTANSEWSTLDVIAGILPKMGDDGEPKYVIEPGCVVDTVRKNSQIHTNHSQYSSTPYMGTWLVIDEFNRANIDKAFGQLFTALRTRELKIPTDKVNVKYDHLPIQKDYRIIGTLNTADKHHLFNLSDALKSRFAYIELDIPKKGQREREIYFTMKNAVRELGLDESTLKIFLVLDHNNKKIDKKTDDKFYARIFQAYEFLDTVRIFKKLGPAVLQLIYQNLITGVQLRIDNRATLDTALTSTLIPQLENLESSSIGAIHAMHTDTLDSFFKDAYKDLNKLNYVETFETVLISLNVSDEDKNRIISKFENDALPDDDGDWKIINDAFDKKKENIAIKLEHLSSALLDLKKSMII